MSSRFPKRSYELTEPCTRALVGQMLRNRGYQLKIVSYKKDKGMLRVFMYDQWADPMMVQIGTYQRGDQPDWCRIYDAAMDQHLEAKAAGTRYGA